MARLYEPEDALEVLRTRDREEHPVMTAPEIAEDMGASRPTATDRLNVLVERGVVERLEVGPTTAYYLEGEEFAIKPSAAEESDTEGDGETGEESNGVDKGYGTVSDGGRPWAEYVQVQTALWGERAAFFGVVLTLASGLAVVVTWLPLPDILPVVAAFAALVVSFVAILSAVILLVISVAIAGFRGHDRGEVLDALFERTLGSTQ